MSSVAKSYVKGRKKTYVPKAEDISRSWWVVDAAGKCLGRLASKIAAVLSGKHKPMYTQHLDTGDFVVVINADKIDVTGNKRKTKPYYRHTGHMGGLKTVTFDKLIATFPERVLGAAVERMLSRNTLGRQKLSKLKIYAGDKHPHAAQQPEALEV